MLKRYQHAPAHLIVDNAFYFITGAIYNKRPLLKCPTLKNQLLNLLHGYFDKHGWTLQYWVILDNHYHIIGKSRGGKDLTSIIRNVHRVSAIEIHRATRCDKPVWWNYWDFCPRYEKEYMIRVNYLLYNPVKHGYVKNLRDYHYSCFNKYFDEQGRDVLLKQFQDYPDYKTLVLHEAQEDDF